MWRWILNTTETKIDNKISIRGNNYLTDTISLLTIYMLLLAVISITLYYHDTRCWKKQKHLLPYNDTNNNLKWIDVDNII